MKWAITVHLGERATPLGSLRYDQQGARESAAFAYDASWLAGADRFAIEPGLPLITGPQFHRRTRDGSVFHAAIADTEPDGWGRRVIQRDHAKRRQEARRRGDTVDPRPLTAMDYLLAVDDVSRVGALRFQDEAGRYQRAGEPGRRTTPPLIELSQLLSASRAIETNTETEADLTVKRPGILTPDRRPKLTPWLSVARRPWSARRSGSGWCSRAEQGSSRRGVRARLRPGS